eukprot:6269967-Prymnesium_polylepis.3
MSVCSPSDSIRSCALPVHVPPSAPTWTWSYKSRLRDEGNEHGKRGEEPARHQRQRRALVLGRQYDQLLVVRAHGPEQVLRLGHLDQAVRRHLDAVARLSLDRPLAFEH